MMVGGFIKFTKEFLERCSNDKTFFEKEIRKELKAYLHKNSVKVLKARYQKGTINDDFIRNSITVVYKGKGYKVSRIIKNKTLAKIN